jgi:phosphatidylglycerol---prolipoprotein diacylglyceryl transferase
VISFSGRKRSGSCLVAGRLRSPPGRRKLASASGWSRPGFLTGTGGRGSWTPITSGRAAACRGWREVCGRRVIRCGPAGAGTLVRPRPAALATAPGIVTGSWAGFVAVGLALALAVLVILLHRAGASGALALTASLVGAAGGRGWYVLLQRGQVSGLPTQGLCIQGFIVGGSAAGIPGLLIAGIPAGTFFGAAAPAMFFAMALGRQGCFFTGCCAGRPTGSRWGMWSSDGRIGARRIPAQQLECLACLLIGAGALAAFLRLGSSAGGAVFIAAEADYILACQGLLVLRAEPRRWHPAEPVTVAASATALLADVLIAALR